MRLISKYPLINMLEFVTSTGQILYVKLPAHANLRSYEVGMLFALSDIKALKGK